MLQSTRHGAVLGFLDILPVTVNKAMSAIGDTSWQSMFGGGIGTNNTEAQ